MLLFVYYCYYWFLTASLFLVSSKDDEEDLPASHFLRGNEYYRSGDVSGARLEYEKALSLDQTRPYVWTNYGHVCSELNLLSAAHEAFATANNLSNTSKTNYNLAVSFQKMSSFNESIKHYGIAVSLSPGEVKALFNLGVLYQELGNFTQAIHYYELALGTKPNHKESKINLCNIMYAMNNYDSAESCYLEVLNIYPHYVRAIINLAELYLTDPSFHNESISLYETALELDPDNIMAQHGLSSLTGANVRALQQDYVRELFDSYSFHFEHSLSSLNYRSHELISAKIANITYSNTPEVLIRILDLGAGTGLVCQALLASGWPYAWSMNGVDLSSKMIEKAKIKDCYKELVVSDILDYLQKNDVDASAPVGSSQVNYDVIVAADVFMYFGDLSQLLRLSYGRLSAGGVLIFTTEQLCSFGEVEEAQQLDVHTCEDPVLESMVESPLAGGTIEIAQPNESKLFRLQTSGRFAHSEYYVVEALKGVGFKRVDSVATIPRFDKGLPVRGLLFTAEKH